MGMFDLSLLGSGQRRAPGGILGGEGGWQNTVGLLGAAMKDAGAAFSGGESNALQDYNARNQQMQIRQQLMGALTSPDPAIRQKAYAVAPMFGVDPAAFQKQQAAQALPGVLDATRSSTEALDPITAQLPKFNIPTAGGGTMQAGGMPVSSGSAPMLPKLSIQDAIAQSNSPELQQQYAPKLLEQMFAGPVKVGKDERLFDPNDLSKPLVDAAPDLPEGMRMGANGPEWLPSYLSGRQQISAAGRSVTNVNNNMGSNGIDYGKPADGLVWKRDASGKVLLDNRGAPIGIPYQGGKAYIEQQQKDAAAKNAAASKRVTSDIVVTDIDRLLSKVDGGMASGWVGSKLAGVAGTDASDVSELIAGIDANLAFDKIQAMRAASPTGAALGAVSEGELKLLKSAMGSIAQRQSKDQLKFNANRVKDIYIDTVHGPGTAKRMREAQAANKPPPGPAGLPRTSPAGTIKYDAQGNRI